MLKERYGLKKKERCGWNARDFCKYWLSMQDWPDCRVASELYCAACLLVHIGFRVRWLRRAWVCLGPLLCQTTRWTAPLTASCAVYLCYLPGCVWRGAGPSAVLCYVHTFERKYSMLDTVQEFGLEPRSPISNSQPLTLDTLLVLRRPQFSQLKNAGSYSNGFRMLL